MTERCERCGRNVETAWSDAARMTLCERCYGALESARYQPGTRRVVKLRVPHTPSLPEWQQHRQRVIELMVRDGAFIYIDRDCCAGICPRCDGVLFVTFVGRTTETHFECVRGCTEAAIARLLGKRTDAAVEG